MAKKENKFALLIPLLSIFLVGSGYGLWNIYQIANDEASVQEISKFTINIKNASNEIIVTYSNVEKPAYIELPYIYHEAHKFLGYSLSATPPNSQNPVQFPYELYKTLKVSEIVSKVNSSQSTINLYGHNSLELDDDYVQINVTKGDVFSVTNEKLVSDTSVIQNYELLTKRYYLVDEVKTFKTFNVFSLEPTIPNGYYIKSYSISNNSNSYDFGLNDSFTFTDTGITFNSINIPYSDGRVLNFKVNLVKLP